MYPSGLGRHLARLVPAVDTTHRPLVRNIVATSAIRHSVDVDGFNMDVRFPIFHSETEGRPTARFSCRTVQRRIVTRGKSACLLWMASVDGSRVVKCDFQFWRFGRVQSSVRPVDAVDMDCWP